MKLVLEIECNDQSFNLDDLDWFVLEGGTYKSDDEKITTRKEKTLFSYIFKCNELKLNGLDLEEETVKETTFNFSQISNEILEIRNASHELMFFKYNESIQTLQKQILELNERIKELENNRSRKTPDIIMNTSLPIPPPPPPPPPQPQPQLHPLRTNKQNVTKKKYEKTKNKPKSTGPLITLDDIKKVKLKKRSEVTPAVE